MKEEITTFDRNLICNYGLRNFASETGSIEGFELRCRVPFYRGIPLSLVEEIDVCVDGETYTSEKIRFTAAGGSFMISEMSELAGGRWEDDEEAVLRIHKPGGIAYPVTSVEIWITLGGPYGKLTGHDKKVLKLGVGGLY